MFSHVIHTQSFQIRALIYFCLGFSFSVIHISTLYHPGVRTRVQHKVMIHVGCICGVKVYLRYILVLPSPQTVEYNCMFTCHQQFLEGSALMPFYENLHLITFANTNRVFSVRESGFGILYVICIKCTKLT